MSQTLWSQSVAARRRSRPQRRARVVGTKHRWVCHPDWFHSVGRQRDRCCWDIPKWRQQWL